MLSEQEFRELIEDLESQNLSLRVASLKVLRDYPSRDQRILPYLEDLLHDKTPCLIAIPFVYAEIRWLAAHALLAERAALGINQPVCLWNIMRPIDYSGYADARDAANITGRGRSGGVLESIALLRDQGYLPMTDLNLSPLPEAEAVPARGYALLRHSELVPA
jgi:HEAT repeat protein